MSHSEKTSLVDKDKRGSFKYSQEESGKEEGVHTYEEVLTIIGTGKFHYILLALCGWALSSDAIEILSISFILPPATCDLNLSNSNKGWLNSMVFIGMMVGSFLWGTLADIYGRRNILLYSLTLNGIGGILSSICQLFPLFLFLRFVSGIGVGGSMPVIFTYFTEFQSKDRRGKMISLLATFWMSGNIIAAGLAWLIIPQDIGVTSGDFVYNSWRIYLAICTIPAFTSALLFFFMPESPKFMLYKQRSEAVLSLGRIFQYNNPQKTSAHFPVREIKHEKSEAFHTSIEVVDGSISSGSCCTSAQQSVIKFMKSTADLYRQPYLVISIIMTIIYFTLSFGYYGLFLWFPELFNRIEKYGGTPCSLEVVEMNTTNLNTTLECDYTVSNKIFLESFLTAISNLPGNILTFFIIDLVGRKILLAGSMVVSGAAVFILAALKNSTQSLIMSCVFSAISVMGWNSLDVIGVELYPTRLRSTASGIFMSVGRIAAVLGNVTFGSLVDVYCLVPMFIAAFLLAIGGFSSLKLPNTTKVDLPN